MHTDVRFSSLTRSRQRLVRLLQHVHFGRVEHLHVLNGEPVFEPAQRVVRTLKVGGKNEARPQASADDFVLKAGVRELLDHLDDIRDGAVERIEVAHGLPLILEVEAQV